MHIIEAAPYSLQEGFKQHRHADGYELYLFYLGHGTFRIGTQDVPFSSPRLFLVPPRSDHRLRVAPECRLVRIYGIRFTWAADTAPLQKKARRLLAYGSSVDTHTSLSAFDGIRKRVAADDPFLALSAGAWLTSFLYDICADERMEPAITTNPHVAEAVHILRDSVFTPMNVDELAARVGIHKAYLIRLFKKHMGTTPMRYLLDFRIEWTTWQLAHTDKPINQIAREYLFYDEFHFSRVFKERRGMPPRQYRETARKA